jgi:hypothetical protein
MLVSWKPAAVMAVSVSRLEFSQGACLVGHRAQHQRCDSGVHAGIGTGQGIGGAVDPRMGMAACWAVVSAKARRYGSGSTASSSVTAGG